MDESQIQKTISDMVNFTIYSMRTPLQHFPDEVGLQYSTRMSFSQQWMA